MENHREFVDSKFSTISVPLYDITILHLPQLFGRISWIHMVVVKVIKVAFNLPIFTQVSQIDIVSNSYMGTLLLFEVRYFAILSFFSCRNGILSHCPRDNSRLAG